MQWLFRPIAQLRIEETVRNTLTTRTTYTILQENQFLSYMQQLNRLMLLLRKKSVGVSSIAASAVGVWKGTRYVCTHFCA